MCMITYYHYTSKDGLVGIISSRKIQQSPSGLHGPGVYLTRLKPQNGRKKIADNNWDGAATWAEQKGKLDFVISVKLPDHRVERPSFFGRIYVFREDVDLDKTTYKLFSKYGDHKGLDAGHTDDELSDDEDDSSCTIS